jgi:hypothetical protein
MLKRNPGLNFAMRRRRRAASGLADLLVVRGRGAETSVLFMAIIYPVLENFPPSKWLQLCFLGFF